MFEGLLTLLCSTHFYSVLLGNFQRSVMWFHFTDEKTESQSDNVACLRPHG